jgi:hypothetical protein
MARRRRSHGAALSWGFAGHYRDFGGKLPLLGAALGNILPLRRLPEPFVLL